LFKEKEEGEKERQSAKLALRHHTKGERGTHQTEQRWKVELTPETKLGREKYRGTKKKWKGAMMLGAPKGENRQALGSRR